MKISFWCLVSIVLAVGSAPASQLRRVKQDANGANDGTSWDDAYTCLAEAINDAGDDDVIWVAEGIHLPTIEANGSNMESGPRAASFGVISKRIRLYGGFNGTESARSERDWVAHPTILSGDLGVQGDPSDNAYTVLHSFSGTLIVDGFTIRDGNSDGTALGTSNDFDGNGGGVFQIGGTTTFANCRIYDNYASYGGAMYLVSGSINLLNCSFVNNQARWVGGAINGRGDTYHRISHCTFFGNQGSRGAVFAFTGSSSTTTVSNCLFGGNSGGGWDHVEAGGTLVATRNVLQQELDDRPDNLVAGALFVDTDGSYADGVRQLRAGSPGVDYGNTAGIMPDITDMDGDGNSSEPLPLDLLRKPRPLENPSVGAFQFINLEPTALVLSDAEIEENRQTATQVGILSTEDPNLGQFSYSLVSGPGDSGNASFSISGNRLRTAEVFDFETQASYEVRIRSTDITDDLGQFVEQSFVVTILDSVDQTLTVTVVQPYAYEPRGGWPADRAHIGRVRIERSGDVSAALSANFSVSSTVFGNNEEFLLQPTPPAVLEFGPGETAFEFEVVPLFDDDDGQGEGDPDEDLVFFTISEAPLDYQLLTSSASITIFDRPVDAWVAERNQDGLEIDFFDYVLAEPTQPGERFTPHVSFDPLAGISTSVIVHRAVLDYQIGIEVSEDLIEWKPAGVTPTIVNENANHQTLNYTVPSEGMKRRFLRMVPKPRERPDDRVLDSPAMVLAGIPAGGFFMGSPSSETGRGVDEGPLTNVQLTRSFWMSTTEVTQGQYHALMGGEPETGAELPMTNLNFEEVREFAAALDLAERNAGRVPGGYQYRLPTEAEWEHAARAGSQSPHHFENPQEIDRYAWHLGNSFLVTRPVGQKAPNAWGLYDTAGNVSEWCLDNYQPALPGGLVFDPVGDTPSSERSIRGGHLFQSAEDQRSASRQQAEPTFSSMLLGFRIVLAPEVSP